VTFRVLEQSFQEYNSALHVALEPDLPANVKKRALDLARVPKSQVF
jgi:hypothetical protein